MAATKSSVSAALRRAGFNARRTGISSGNPLVLFGGNSDPVRVNVHSKLLGRISGVDPDTVARFAKQALQLAEECHQALTAAGYTCTDIEADDEFASFSVTRD